MLAKSSMQLLISETVLLHHLKYHSMYICLQSTIPETLLTFMKLVLQGPACLGAGSEGINKQRSNVACTLSHLIMFNTVKREVPGKTVMRHNKTREMPFPLHVGLKIHTDAKLFINFEKLGLCISYQREREINRAFAIGVSVG